MSILDQPRYRDSPINLFLENLVLDIIGQLPPGADAKIQDMDLQHVFKASAVEWRQVIREVLHLSPTFDTAVLDLWYRNSDRAQEEGFEYIPFHFAQEFVDRYFADDSKVDVWTPDTLRAAKARIAERAAQRGDAPDGALN